MSKSNDLTQQLILVLHEMVSDYGFNRCDEKRLKTIGEAKKLLAKTAQQVNKSRRLFDKARAGIDQLVHHSAAMEPALGATIAELKAVYAETSQGHWNVDPQGCFVLDQSDVDLNEIVQIMNKGVAFTTAEAGANLIFIAQAHNAMPFLIAEIERLQFLDAKVERLREQIEQLRSVFDALHF